MAVIRNVGIDLASKGMHEAAILDEAGRELRKGLRFGWRKADLDGLIEAVTGGQEGVEVHVFMEPTGTAWMTVGQYLAAAGWKVYLVKVQLVHDLRKFFKKYVKNDRWDALSLAKMPLLHPEVLHEVDFNDRRHLSLRTWVKRQHRLSKTLTAIKLRLQGKAELAMPGISRLFDDPSTAVGRVVYGQYLDPFKVKRVGVTRLIRVFKRVGAHSKRPIEELAAALLALAEQACEVYRSPDGAINFEDLQEEIRDDLDIVDLLQNKLERAREKAQELYQNLHPGRQLESIYGVGKISAPAFLAALATRKFPNAKAFRAYIGLVPRVKESGELESKGQRLTKAGASWLKASLYLAAETARRFDPQLALVYYRERVEKGRSHRQAVCAVATRLADRMYAVIKANRDYELRDLEGNPISPKQARDLIQAKLTVPEEILERTRRRKNGEAQAGKRGAAIGSPASTRTSRNSNLQQPRTNLNTSVHLGA